MKDHQKFIKQTNKKNNKKDQKDHEHTAKTMQERLRNNSESALNPASAQLSTDSHPNIQTEVKRISTQEQNITSGAPVVVLKRNVFIIYDIWTASFL